MVSCKTWCNVKTWCHINLENILKQSGNKYNGYINCMPNHFCRVEWCTNKENTKIKGFKIYIKIYKILFHLGLKNKILYFRFQIGFFFLNNGEDDGRC